ANRAVGPRDESSDPLRSSPLGDFQILREIGRGGMGVVYEATQLSLGRRVALKVLPFAATIDAKHLHRFRRESTAAAQLHHTNIVPVYYVGCERGVNFYAMQLIEGKTLAELITEMREHKSATATTNVQDLAGMIELGANQASEPHTQRPSATTPVGL